MPTYISKKGLEKLKQELEERRNVIRHDIAERLAFAKELGDLSENFEYQEAKDAQALNETRVVELEGMIKDAVVVEQRSGEDTISLGTTFKVESNGAERKFEMVGSSEADPVLGKISNESPIGQAFLGCRAGETVEVSTPSGAVQYTVKEIQ